jgi:glutamate carboxypeptidase
MKKFVPSRLKERLEKLMGSALLKTDLSFVHDELPLTELERLQEFSRVDAQTLARDGVAQLQDKVAADLESLGFRLQWIKGEQRFADLLVAERAGRRNSYISLVTHTDTVLGNERPFELDLTTRRAYGSGVIDNKGGVIVGLSGLRRFLKKYPETEHSLRWICSPNEEMGSIGFTDTFREFGQDSVVAFGLEPALDNGAIINQRRGNRWYDIEVRGREAHAGRSYGHHANAAHDLAEKIRQLAALTNYRKHVSLSVGHIHAGKDKHNVICGFAHAKLDVRFPSFEARDRLHKQIEKILERPVEVSVDGAHETKTTYKIVDDCPPFSLTPRTKALARGYAAFVSQLEGRRIGAQGAGGAGDVNYLSTDRNLVLDGLGPVGGEMHTTREFVAIDTLKTRAQSLAGFLHHVQTWKP